VTVWSLTDSQLHLQTVVIIFFAQSFCNIHLTTIHFIKDCWYLCLQIIFFINITHTHTHMYIIYMYIYIYAMLFVTYLWLLSTSVYNGQVRSLAHLARRPPSLQWPCMSTVVRPVCHVTKQFVLQVKRQFTWQNPVEHCIQYTVYGDFIS